LPGLPTAPPSPKGGLRAGSPFLGLPTEALA